MTLNQQDTWHQYVSAIPRYLPSCRVRPDRTIAFADADADGRDPDGCDGQDSPDDGSSPPSGDPPKPSRREKLGAARAITIAAMQAATTPSVRRRLRSKRSLALVVEVPSKGWVKAVNNYFHQQMPTPWDTFCRDGSDRSQKSDVGNDDVCRYLAAGGHVVGIAANVTILPSALIAAADITIRIAAPTGAVIREAMRRCLHGRVPPVIEDDLVAGLELEDIIAALRAGSTPAEAIERLASAARQRADRNGPGEAPLLEAAVEYGAAREWGLALARDIAEFKAGRLAWRECDRGAVVYSDPGCGKSVLAGSIANACGIPLIRTSVAELFASNGGDLGAVIKAQRAVFARAAAVAPCLLFLDEIDALPDRATLSPRGRDWWMPVINDFLLLLDSAVAGQRAGIVVMGATNRIDAVDPALLRPGRLERAIEIQRPDVAGIVNILRFQLAGDLPDADLTPVAEIVEGATAAELMDLVRSARRIARQAGRVLTQEDLRTIAFGQSASEDPDFLRRAAIHEAGHAVITAVHRPGAVVRVTIVSKGTTAGATLCRQSQPAVTLSTVEDHVVESLAGGEAERIILGCATTGSGGSEDSDIARSTRAIAALHTSTTLAGGPVFLCPARDAIDFLRLDSLMRRAVQAHLVQLMLRTGEEVLRYQGTITIVADELVRRRMLSGREVDEIVRQTAPSTSDGCGSAANHQLNRSNPKDSLV
jgi:hypothetical protein